MGHWAEQVSLTMKAVPDFSWVISDVTCCQHLPNAGGRGAARNSQPQAMGGILSCGESSCLG